MPAVADPGALVCGAGEWVIADMGVSRDLPKASILVVEDDPEQQWIYAQTLSQYHLTFVSTGSEALESLRQAAPDLILLDHILRDGELGGQWLPRLKDAAAHVPIIVISGILEPADKIEMLQGPRSASFVVTKPVRMEELERTVEIALTECGVGEAVRILQSMERAEKGDLQEPDRRFVERLARQHDMLRKLRAAGAPANVSQLSRDYHVSRRTIARDLQELVQRGQLPAALYPDLEVEESKDSPK